ncbi:hypothetical protein [Natronomonas marina]|uniref:hypothetical protein n=1 Tax=Natronomonas marina TaxID=2961939 RepID=UPI0020C9E9CA|nr:hypothetical protein [Natronomonas marina]
MSRPTALPALALVALLLAAGSGVAAPPPTPVCEICGEAFHENVTATDATLQVREDGDVRWRVENELTEPTAGEWRENPGRAETRVEDALDNRFRPPVNPTDPTVEIEDGTLTIEFVDRGAARQRLGLLVVPYLNGEGSTTNYVINADEFVVAAPDGQRIVNEPSGATVEDGRAVWTGVAATDGDDERSAAWQAPEPGETYVVAGSGPTAGARSAVVTTLEPLDPGLYGRYALGLLFVVLATYGIYRLEGTRLPRRSVAGGIALTVVPYVAAVAAIHPWWPRGLGALVFWPLLGLAIVLLPAVGGGVLYARAAAADRPAR